MTRGRIVLMGAALIVLSATVVVASTWYQHHWVDRLGAFDIHDVQRLPNHIHICGRDWHRDPDSAPRELSFWRARWGIEPAVVDIAPFAPCSPGPCTNFAESHACQTGVLVRVATDGYIAFELIGGP